MRLPQDLRMVLSTKIRVKEEFFCAKKNVQQAIKEKKEKKMHITRMIIPHFTYFFLWKYLSQKMGSIILPATIISIFMFVCFPHVSLYQREQMTWALKKALALSHLNMYSLRKLLFLHLTKYISIFSFEVSEERVVIWYYRQNHSLLGRDWLIEDHSLKDCIIAATDL